MNQFVSGAIFMGFLVCALFFFRAYKSTGDRLFLSFGRAFGLMTLERLALAALLETQERQPLVYVLRLGAFALIIWGILRKNAADDQGG